MIQPVVIAGGHAGTGDIFLPVMLGMEPRISYTPSNCSFYKLHLTLGMGISDIRFSLVAYKFQVVGYRLYLCPRPLCMCCVC